MKISATGKRILMKRMHYTVHYFLLACIFIFAIFPYFWMLMTSLKPRELLLATPPVWIPDHFDPIHYQDVFQRMPFFLYLKNSLYVASVTTVFCILIACLSGYSISRYSFKGKKISYGLFIATQLVPGVLPLVPFYFTLYALRLTNSYTGIILSYTTWGIAFCTMMLQGYFKTAYSVEIEESATIDGCGRWGVFFRIALPLARPGIVATAIFSFLLAWNDYIWASIINTKQQYRLLSNGVQDFQAQFGNLYLGRTMATGLLATIPALILFSFAQKHLVSGLSQGAVKG